MRNIRFRYRYYIFLSYSLLFKERQHMTNQNSNHLRIEDVRKFLCVFERATIENKTTLKDLFESNSRWVLGHYSTTVSQLKRILKYLHHKVKQQNLRKMDLEQFFQLGPDGWLRPTSLAAEFATQFRLLDEMHKKIEVTASDLLVKKADLPLVQIGAPQSVGWWLISAIFSRWKYIFGHKFRLSVDIANSQKLITQLKEGMLDFVFAYAQTPTPNLPEELNLSFKPLLYRTKENETSNYFARMVLFCHPEQELWIRERGILKNANEDYWTKSYKEGRLRKSLVYENLREIDLENVDFQNTTILDIPSWQNPPMIQNLVDRMRAQGCVQEVNGYEEALYLVRMKLGISFITEAFIKRKRVTAFRLIPEDRNKRWIGLYHNNKKPEKSEANLLAEFISAYFKRFGLNILQGSPPAIDNEEYKTWTDDYELQYKHR